MKLKKKLIWIIPAGIVLCAALIAGGIFLQDHRENLGRRDLCLYEGNKTFEETLPEGTDLWRGYPAEHITVAGNTVTVYRTDLDCRYIYQEGALTGIDVGGYSLRGKRTWHFYDVRDIANLYVIEEGAQ